MGKKVNHEATDTTTEKKSTKKHNYKKELEKLRQEKEELQDKLLRTLAEYDNARKRVERDLALIRENTKAEVISALLSVLDDLERSLEAGEKDPGSILEGVRLIQKSFLKALQDQGLKELKSVGEKFDPQLHDALMQVEKEGVEPDRVVEEHLKGYMLNDRVLRHAKVVVSK